MYGLAVYIDINKSITQPNDAHMCAAINEKVQFLQTEQNKYVLKRDLSDDSDKAHWTSFGIEFQTKENELSPSVALLCAGLLRRGMVCELEQVL